jgi:hypothetical protein
MKIGLIAGGMDREHLPLICPIGVAIFAATPW